MKYAWLKWTKKLWLKIDSCMVYMDDVFGIKTLYVRL